MQQDQPTRVGRRLAAIVAADVAGYSRLMGLDEVGTARTLREHRKVTDALVEKHGGRLVKSTGDGVLLEFASVVDAVECSVAIQAVMAQRNDGVPPDGRMLFRIGINLGDILIEGEDILGDGVNVAARLESIAEPGGICISSSAYDQVRGKVEMEFADLGEQSLKNIASPVRVYSIKSSGRSIVAADVLFSHPETRRPLPLPDKPSIAVLPFQNMSGDPEQEYFADGIAEDIITELSRFKSLFVIARNSSFTYKGKAVDVKRVGRELGVRYVLEGSVRKAGSRVRITGQLIEAATDKHLWAEKFDGALEDVFGLQDQVTASVVGLIAPKLEQAEIERTRQKPTDSLDSYDLLLRGMALAYGRGNLTEARDFFYKAIEQDPGYGAAYAMAATTIMWQQGSTGAPLTPEMRAEAIRLAHRGARVGGDDALALARSAHVLTYIGREYEFGSALVEQAVTLNPNLSVAWYSRGWVALMCGDGERAIESFERMIGLSPLDRLKVSAWNGISFAHLALGQYEKGRAAALQSIRVVKDAHTMGAYIINSVLAGRLEEAKEAAAQLLQLQPGFRVSHSITAFPVRMPEDRDRIVAALIAAGVPE